MTPCPKPARPAKKPRAWNSTLAVAEAKLRPKKSIARKSPPKKRPRPKSETLRIQGTPERVQWIAARPCVVCGGGPCQGHHVVNGGKGRKADAKWIVPLCVRCHRQYHDHGCVETHEMPDGLKYRYTRKWLIGAAEATEDAWQQYRGGTK